MEFKKDFGGNQQQDDQLLDEELDENGEYINNSPSGAMNAVLAKNMDEDDYNRGIAGDSEKSKLNKSIQQNGISKVKSPSKPIASGSHTQRIYIMDKKLMDGKQNLTLLDIAIPSCEDKGVLETHKFLFDVDKSEFYQLQMVGNDQVSTLLADGTFIRKNRVYTLTKYSTVILLLKILLSRCENSAILALSRENEEENGAPFEVVRQIIEHMLDKYDEGCQTIEAVNNPEDPVVLSPEIPTREQLHGILLQSKPLRRALNLICEYKELEVGGHDGGDVDHDIQSEGNKPPETRKERVYRLSRAKVEAIVTSKFVKLFNTLGAFQFGKTAQTFSTVEQIRLECQSYQLLIRVCGILLAEFPLKLIEAWLKAHLKLSLNQILCKNQYLTQKSPFSNQPNPSSQKQNFYNNMQAKTMRPSSGAEQSNFKFLGNAKNKEVQEMEHKQKLDEIPSIFKKKSTDGGNSSQKIGVKRAHHQSTKMPPGADDEKKDSRDSSSKAKDCSISKFLSNSQKTPGAATGMSRDNRGDSGETEDLLATLDAPDEPMKPSENQTSTTKATAAEQIDPSVPRQKRVIPAYKAPSQHVINQKIMDDDRKAKDKQYQKMMEEREAQEEKFKKRSQGCQKLTGFFGKKTQ